MCGICGFIHPDRNRPADRVVLERMNSRIHHRGPDSDGFFLRNHVGLAMRRLAIIDLDTGDQPISNETGDLQLVFNGEIYNYTELRQSLESKGHVFKTQADTETIVHLYEEYGADCVQHLRGMFAFALWDETRERLMLARDRMGQKPLYYAQLPDALVFGSEIKCLAEWPGMPLDIDHEAIHHYLTLQYIPDPWSGYKAIRKLPPAHTLIWEKGNLDIARYWDMAYTPKHDLPEAELCEQLRDTFEEAVRIRMISDVPLGAHLSGGIDSSLVVAAMARHASQPVRTFSIGFEEEAFSELAFARSIADRFSTEHHEFKVTYGDVPQMMQRIAEACDEPFADPSALPMYYLSELTRQHVTVALNGDGGDELFAGYQRYRLDQFANLYARLPRALTQRLIPAVANLLPEPVNRPIEANPIAGIRRLQQVADTRSCASIARWGSYFSESMKAELWRPEWIEKLQQSNSETLLCEAFHSIDANSFLDRTLYADSTNYLPGDLLVKADRMTMAHSLEGRSPFLDHELVNWAARLPESLKLRGKTHKYLLKKAFADDLPDSILHRSKQGFGIPVGAWLRGPLAGWARETLLDTDSSTHTYFRTDTVERLVNEHASARADHGKRIWTLLMFELWLRQSSATP
jgi:asparagine synthase (glutamine-hydrolysing)